MKTNRYKIVLVWLIIMLSTFFSRVSAQQILADSIKNVLKGKLSMSERALGMKNLATYYEIIDTVQSLKYYDEAIVYAKSQKLTYETGVIYYNKSFVYSDHSNYQKVKHCLDSALIYLKASRHEKALLTTAKVYNAISNNCGSLNNFKESVDYQLKAIQIFEKLQKYPNLVTSYYNLSNIYKGINEFGKQEECGRKILEFAGKTGKNRDYFISNFIIAYSLTMMNNYDEAFQYINDAKKYYSDKYEPISLISYHLISGLLNMNLNKLNEAENDFSKSLKLAENAHHIHSIIQSKIQLARVLTLQKKFSDAEIILKSAEIEINKTGENSQRNIILDYFSQLYEESGDYKRSLHYYKIYKQLNDSLSSTENKHYLSELQTKFEVLKKENEIKTQQAKLDRRNSLIVFLIVLLLSLFIISFSYYRYYKQKQIVQQQLIEKLEIQQHLAATEAVLKGEEQERSRLAKDLHDGLGGMLSGIKYSFTTMKGNLVMTPENHQAFERSMDMLDSSIREMRRVAHNMMPEALVRFGLDTALNDFCNDINQSGALNINYQSIGLEGALIDQTTAITLYRIVQELINNTMKHAKATTAIVQLTRSQGQLSLTVEDNGKGFDTGILKVNKGTGWVNIQNRVEFLKGQLDITSKEGEGTSVHIELLT